MFAVARLLTPDTIERVAAALIATGTEPQYARRRALRIAQGVALRTLAGFTLSETATALGCSRRTVASDVKAGAAAVATYEERGEGRGELPERV
jgi:predicted transcriptional regulator